MLEPNQCAARFFAWGRGFLNHRDSRMTLVNPADVRDKVLPPSPEEAGCFLSFN